MKNFNEKFKLNELTITETDLWIISLRPEQVTLGSLILSLKRKCKTLGELTNQEGQDFSLALKIVEQTLLKNFDPDKINYLALMMVDEHVHFHIIPRYSKPMAFDDVLFEDKKWPYPPTLSETISLEDNSLSRLLQHFKDSI